MCLQPADKLNAHHSQIRADKSNASSAKQEHNDAQLGRPKTRRNTRRAKKKSVSESVECYSTTKKKRAKKCVVGGDEDDFVERTPRKLTLMDAKQDVCY